HQSEPGNVAAPGLQLKFVTWLLAAGELWWACCRCGRGRQGYGGLPVAQVGGNQQGLFTVASSEHQSVPRAVEKFDITFQKHRLRAPPAEEGPVGCEHRILLGMLQRNGSTVVFIINRQPGAGIRKTTMAFLMMPNHWRTTSVPAFELRPEGDAVWIDQILVLQFRFGQAQFFALIDADAATQGQQ